MRSHPACPVSQHCRPAVSPPLPCCDAVRGLLRSRRRFVGALVVSEDTFKSTRVGYLGVVEAVHSSVGGGVGRFDAGYLVFRVDFGNEGAFCHRRPSRLPWLVWFLVVFWLVGWLVGFVGWFLVVGCL